MVGYERNELGVAVPAVRLGGLPVAGNDWLTDLPGWTVDFELKPAASIAIRGNSNLRDCDAADWAAGLPGHAGPVSIFGNQPCP